jgi:hypothetical protein
LLLSPTPPGRRDVLAFLLGGVARLFLSVIPSAFSVAHIVATHTVTPHRCRAQPTSSGGDCALNLCRAISRHKKYFWHTDPTKWGFSASASTSSVIGQTCVDLLVTVDAARGYFSDGMDRSVAGCVASNENYYQLNKKWDQQLSHGAPNVADDPSFTKINNENFTPRADHFAMGWMTREKAFNAIKACRGI